MILVSANTPPFGFVIFFCSFRSLQFFFKIVSGGTIFKNKIFCRDYFFYKMVMCHVCKSLQKWDQGPKPKRNIFAGTKNYKKNYRD